METVIQELTMEPRQERRLRSVRPIPETGFVSIQQVLAVIPYGETTWWNGVKSGRFPKSIKLSARKTVWRAEDIHALIRQLSASLESHSDS